MASMPRRSHPADLGGTELSRSRATPEKWEPGWLRLAYKATCRRELAQLAVKHLAPASHSVTLDRQRLHPIGAKGQD